MCLEGSGRLNLSYSDTRSDTRPGILAVPPSAPSIGRCWRVIIVKYYSHRFAHPAGRLDLSCFTRVGGFREDQFLTNLCRRVGPLKKDLTRVGDLSWDHVRI